MIGQLESFFPLLMFAGLLVFLMLGYPVAFSLGGTAIAFALVGAYLDLFWISDFSFVPSKIFGVISNFTLVAVPLFIFMGMLLEKSGIAEELIETMEILFCRVRGGLLISVVLVGTLLAASTGIVGATVVTMGVLALPSLLSRGYDKSL
ncbi:MAG: TRAP transporter large permease subunit, partial [Bdellovibrionales bacterium]|nr:TRAP transporter large permease subunit [Bdellovibrionales bacterium]